MAAPRPAQMPPSEIVDGTIELSHKTGAPVHYSMVQSTQPDKQRTMIVFLNGLMTVKTTWLPVMAGIIRQRKGTSAGIPLMLAYDRYGQGLTESCDPQDENREPGHGHDAADAATDLFHIINILAKDAPVRLVLVGNSIGCAIARLYAAANPVAAALFLDSIMANSDFDFWPNPDAPGFQKSELPEDVTVEELRMYRAKYKAIFHPGNANKEGLSRRNLAEILPLSDRPILKGQDEVPWVTVVGHDFEKFADESAQGIGFPKYLTMRYANPIWHEYNQGLARLTDPKHSKGPFQAKGCGHFIQRDDPNLVVDETLDLVDKVRMHDSAVW